LILNCSSKPLEEAIAAHAFHSAQRSIVGRMPSNADLQLGGGELI
jgi:hypothetical protein